MAASGDVASLPSRAYKTRGGRRAVSDQQRRRELALQRQQSGRRNLQNLARKIAFDYAGEEEEEEEEQEDYDHHDDRGQQQQHEEGLVVDEQPSTSASCGEGMAVDNVRQHARARDGTATASKRGGKIGAGSYLWGQAGWALCQVMMPEWMVDIPSDLGGEAWLVLPRPEGQRCMVVSSGGATVSRTARRPHNRILHRFPSRLPGGARGNPSGADNYAILDCIFHAADQTYYVLDMLCWNGVSFYDCSADFRVCWAQSKLDECGATGPPAHKHKFRFAAVPSCPCDAAGLQRAYQGAVPFTRDGLVFYNKQAHYVLGLTPLMLLWKDARCSQYFVETDAQGNVPARQQVMLQLLIDGTVGTGDDPPVVLGSIPAAFLQQHKDALRPGTLLRFEVGDKGLVLNDDGKPVAADIMFVGIAAKTRRDADSFTKVMFQYAARHDPLDIQQLMAQVESEMMTESNGVCSDESSQRQSSMEVL